MPDGSRWSSAYILLYQSANAAVYEPHDWRFHPKGKRGAAALRPKSEIEKEIRIARLLADNGVSVILRTAGRLGKTPDAFLIQNGEVAEWDFKQLDDSATNAKNSANNNAREAKNQVQRLVYFIPRPIDAIGGVDAVNRGFTSALVNDPEQKLRAIIVLWYTSKMEALTTDEFREGLRCSGL